MAVSGQQKATLPTEGDLASWEFFENWYQKQPSNVQALDEIQAFRDEGILDPQSPLPFPEEIHSLFSDHQISHSQTTYNQARKFSDGEEVQVVVDPEPKVLCAKSTEGEHPQLVGEENPKPSSTPSAPPPKISKSSSPPPRRVEDLTTDTDFLRRVDYYSRSRPDTEFEIFFDPETNSFHYVAGEEGTNQMGEMVIATDESGRMTSGRQTSEPAAPPKKNWIPIGHLHPQGNPEGVTPSVGDVVTMLQRGGGDYFTFQKNSDGSISWSRIYTNDDGQLALEFSNNVANRAVLQQEFSATADSALEFLRHNPDEELAAAVPFAELREVVEEPPPPGMEPPAPLQTALSRLRPSNGDGVTIGRENNCGLYFGDIVSGGHLTLFMAEDGFYYITDHSRYGTMIFREGGTRQYALHNGIVRSLHRRTIHQSPLKLNDGDIIVFPDGENFVFRKPPTTLARETVKAEPPPAKPVVSAERPLTNLKGEGYRLGPNGSAVLIDGPTGQLALKDQATDLEVSAASHMGIGYKEVNEDGLAVISVIDSLTGNRVQYHLSVDGMGGEGKGDLAMRHIIDAVSAELAKGTSPEQAISIAKARLDGDPNMDRGNGAVLVLAKFEKKPDGQVDISTWVYGDARAVVFRPSSGGEILRTQDQSLVQTWRDRGDLTSDFDQRTHPRSNMVLNSLSKGRASSPPHRANTTLQKGDWVVLASDGFWDNFDVSEVYTLLENCKTAEEARQILFDAALKKMAAFNRGEMRVGAKPDNINIIVTRVGFESPSSPPKYAPPPPPPNVRSPIVHLGPLPKMLPLP